MVSGVVRDAHGVPQLGALVELVGPDASVLARAFTDEHGRYLLASDLAGVFQLRVSAAFLIPVVRGNLRLRAGAHAVADLTMTAIFDAGSWLPAEGRRSTEPSDDWRWTLRSMANRPMLRFVDEDSSSASTAEVSSSEMHPRQTFAEGQLALIAGDGTFGNGGAHQVMTVDRTALDGGVSALRTSVGNALGEGAAPSVAVAASMERKRVFGGETRVLVSFASNPALETEAGGGFEVVRTAASERIALGDMIAVDAGTLFTAERLLGNRFASSPYIRIAFQPTSQLTLEYRFATDRSLQQTEDLDQILVPEQVLSDAGGHPILRRASHQELAATETQEKSVVSVAVYRDTIPVEGIGGGGNLSGREMGDLPILSDLSTGTFRIALPGYAASDGARVSLKRTFSPGVSACVEGYVGTALVTDGGAVSLGNPAASVKARTIPGLDASIDVQARRTGTGLDVRYRWQPVRSLTEVDEFDSVPGDAYFGVRLQQRLWAGRRLKGMNAVVEATNLLAQGYEPLLGPDGETLFLAQVPRGVQGGLTFSF